MIFFPVSFDRISNFNWLHGSGHFFMIIDLLLKILNQAFHTVSFALKKKKPVLPLFRNTSNIFHTKK